MDILGLGSKVDVDFILDPQGQRKQYEEQIGENRQSLQYIYYDGEDVSGTVKKKEIVDRYSLGKSVDILVFSTFIKDISRMVNMLLDNLKNSLSFCICLL